MDDLNNNLFPEGGGIGHYLEARSASGQITGDFDEFAVGVGSSPNDAPKEYIRPPAGRKFLKRAFIFAAFFFFILWGKVAFLQIIRGGAYRNLAEGNRLRKTVILAERGIIADRYGRLLVQNVPTFSISVVPEDLPKTFGEKEAVLNTLSEISSVPLQEIKIMIEDFWGSALPVPIKENLSYENALLAEIKAASLSGVRIERGTRRYYTAETDKVMSLSHILGFIGKITKEEYGAKKSKGYLRTDKLGKTGLELIYESFLRGSYGEEKVEVDAFGHKKRAIAKEETIPGKNLILSIDYGAQKILEKSLRDALAASGAKKATAIAMDPRDGAVLALVNLPSYSANAFSVGLKPEEYKNLLEDPNKPLFPRGIAGEYPSGSTIKPFIAAAALDEGIITPSTIVHSAGGISVGEWFFPDWKVGGHGDVNVITAIAQSVNTFFYYIGGGYQGFKGLGVAKIAAHVARFGLGSKLGIDLDGEKPGLLPTEEWKEKTKNEEWYIGDTYHMSIGQGDVLVTPLQIAAGTAAIANGGTLWQPHLLYGYTDADGTSKKIIPKVLNNESAKKESLATVRRGMRETVLIGSARSLKTIGVSAAGKTGTAEWRDGRSPHAWFTGFAPYENPEIVITILIEEGGEGSSTAVPVARDFLQWYFIHTP